ncbi:MAG: hypothetical protein Q8S09_00385 [Hyphomonas sp.]|nr:hypothetical protein [Hyphomonas sp.]
MAEGQKLYGVHVSVVAETKLFIHAASEAEAKEKAAARGPVYLGLHAPCEVKSVWSATEYPDEDHG